jgi:hypothetical protein
MVSPGLENDCKVGRALSQRYPPLDEHQLNSVTREYIVNLPSRKSVAPEALPVLENIIRGALGNGIPPKAMVDETGDVSALTNQQCSCSSQNRGIPY